MNDSSQINFKFYNEDSEIVLECFALDFDDAVEQYYKINEAALSCDPKMYGTIIGRDIIKPPFKIENCITGAIRN